MSNGSSAARAFTTSCALMLTIAGRVRSTAATTAVRRAGLWGPARAANASIAAIAPARKERACTGNLPRRTDLAFRLELGLDLGRLLREIGQRLEVAVVLLLVEDALLHVPLH